MPNRFGRQSVVVAKVRYAWVKGLEPSDDQFVTCLGIQGYASAVASSFGPVRAIRSGKVQGRTFFVLRWEKRSSFFVLRSLFFVLCSWCFVETTAIGGENQERRTPCFVLGALLTKHEERRTRNSVIRKRFFRQRIRC